VQSEAVGCELVRVQGHSLAHVLRKYRGMAPGTMTTPRSRKTSLASSTATPLRIASSNAPPSPHYTTTRRHSLYGTEDRVIIDPGSRVWKIGFSGEARPRAVFHVQGRNGSPLWSLNSTCINQENEEEEHKHLHNALQLELRRVFHRYLLPSSPFRRFTYLSQQNPANRSKITEGDRRRASTPTYLYKRNAGPHPL
jgi:hypothetical protein